MLRGCKKFSTRGDIARRGRASFLSGWGHIVYLYGLILFKYIILEVTSPFSDEIDIIYTLIRVL